MWLDDLVIWIFDSGVYQIVDIHFDTFMIVPINGGSMREVLIDEIEPI